MNTAKFIFGVLLVLTMVHGLKGLTKFESVVIQSIENNNQ